MIWVKPPLPNFERVTVGGANTCAFVMPGKAGRLSTQKDVRVCKWGKADEGYVDFRKSRIARHKRFKKLFLDGKHAKQTNFIQGADLQGVFHKK